MEARQRAAEIDGPLVSFIAETTLRDIPAETITFTKQLGLKTTAGMISGRWESPSRKVIRNITTGPTIGDEAGVVLGGFQTTLPNAILANAVSAHASELEDDRTRPTEDVSWDITTFPLLFPLAQYLRCTGREVVEASAIGLEVLTRLSQLPSRTITPDIIVHPASIASAAAAAKLLGLDREAIRNALGIAMGGGFVFMPNTGTDAHYLDSAFQCLRGYHAADFARSHLTGNPRFDVLQDQLYKSDNDPARVTEGLGSEWVLHEIGVKKFPCCYATHRHIDAVRRFLDDEQLSNEEIETIDVYTDRVAAELCDRPEPSSSDDLKFSYQHILGTVLLDDDVNFEHVSEDALDDPRYTEPRSKITVHSDGSNRRENPAKIVVTTTSDDEFTVEQGHLIGGPQHPLTDEQYRDLFRKFTKHVLPEPMIDETANTLLELDRITDFPALMDELTFIDSTG